MPHYKVVTRLSCFNDDDDDDNVTTETLIEWVGLPFLKQQVAAPEKKQNDTSE